MSASVANRGILGLGPYSASKGGVISLSKVLAAEWAAYGITVNTISPGYMATEMGTRSQRFPGFKELQLSLIPQGRLGEPREFAHSAVFLASEGAAHITGHNLVIDGGYTVW
jgi:NAD(P)-dependent dehydrogenase (short-subunit alcohol dehydrogenase family)